MAKNRKPMHMADWIAKLDDFLKLGDHPLLDGAGRISAKQAQRHVDAEYDRWHTRAINAPSDRPKVFLCASGARTRNNSAALASLVDGEAYCLAGGIMAWRRAGYATERG